MGIPFDSSIIKESNNIKFDFFKKNKEITIGRIGQPNEGSWDPKIIEVKRIHNDNKNTNLLLVGASPKTIEKALKSKFNSKIKTLKTNKISNRSKIIKIHTIIDIFILYLILWRNFWESYY